MRCQACHVDLAETYTKCPLCHGDASPDAPRITAFKNAPYPHGDTPPPVPERVNSGAGLSRERLRAFFQR